jgi:hypothetical protein
MGSSGVAGDGARFFQLVSGPRGAAQARSLLASAMGSLGLPGGLVEDRELAVSELATNAHQHADRAGPAGPVVAPELWVWVRSRPVPQLVVSVFDADRAGLPRVGSAGLLEEHGKGLGLVAAVSVAWGSHPSRCRLGNRPAEGKATWFVLPLPCPWPTGCQAVHPSAAARGLVETLGTRGIDTRCRSDDKGISVVQAGGLNVWVGPQTFSWRCGAEGYVHHPLVDLQEVAEQVVRLYEESQPARPYARQSR